MSIYKVLLISLMATLFSGCATKLTRVNTGVNAFEDLYFEAKKPSYEIKWLSKDRFLVRVWTSNNSAKAKLLVAANETKSTGYTYLTRFSEIGEDAVCVESCDKYMMSSVVFQMSHHKLNKSSFAADIILDELSNKFKI